MFEFKRIAVIGCSGAGKSTFSRRLAALTDLPLYYLDMIYWNKDCTHISRSEFIIEQEKILSTEKWIVDGNFRNTLEYRISKADLIFFFDIPTDVCINGVLTRGKREDMPCDLPADDELIELIKSYNLKCKPMVYDLFEKYSDNKVIVFHSHSDVDNYISDLEKELQYGFNN